MRVEGDKWVAYYALPNTMERAVRLGDIHMNAIRRRPERKNQFLELMQELVADILEERTGSRPHWGGTTRAPESERSGSA